MPKWMSQDGRRMGAYIPFSKIIYLDLDKIKSFPNKEQQFFRVFLHELLHAKQFNLINYASKNMNNKILSDDEKNELKEFLETNKISKKEVENYNKFIDKYSTKDVKNSKELARAHKEIYSKYISATMEVDADNVALALLYRIGKTQNRIIGRFAENVYKLSQAPEIKSRSQEITEIRAFNERRRTKSFGMGRITNLVNTRTFFQEAENEKLIAGYSYQEVMEKMTSMWEEVEKAKNKAKEQELLSKIHILEDSFDVAENSDKYPENQASEIMLNAYYVMNNQELPKEFIEDDINSKRNYDDLKKLPN